MNLHKTGGLMAIALMAVLSSTWSLATDGPTYKAHAPMSLITPDKVQTELLGELEFFDGMPSASTVKKTRDLIGLIRAVDTFLNGIPGTSIYAVLERLKQAGAEPGDLELVK